MNKIADALSSPMIALLLFGPLVLVFLQRGCADINSGATPRRG